MAEIGGEPVAFGQTTKAEAGAEVHSIAQISEKTTKRRSGRFTIMRLSRDKIDSGSSDPKAQSTELKSRNAELTREVEKLKLEIKESMDSSSQAAALSGQFRTQLSALREKNEVMNQHFKELTAETDGLKASLTEANTQLKNAKEELEKSKSLTSELRRKIAKARRPLFGFNSQVFEQIPADVLDVQSSASAISHRRTRSMDASQSWYGHFCGNPSDAMAISTTIHMTRDSVDSWYDRFCGLSEEK